MKCALPECPEPKLTADGSTRVTDLEQGGYLHTPRVRRPNGGVGYTFVPPKNVCPIVYLPLMPDVLQQYLLSLNATTCEGPAGFAPVRIKRWLRPHTVSVYIVKNPLTDEVVDYGPAVSGGSGIQSVHGDVAQLHNNPTVLRMRSGTSQNARNRRTHCIEALPSKRRARSRRKYVMAREP